MATEGCWFGAIGDELRFAPAVARLVVSGVPEAKTIGFSANLQGGINLALGLALSSRLCR